MISHVVIFRTRHKDRADLLYEGVKTLGNIEFVKFFHCGKPVPSPRPVVDDFFDVAAVICLENEAALQAYSEHPIHLNFVKNYRDPAHAKVQVYDFID